MPGRPAVWKPSLGLCCRTLCLIASVPVRSLLTKKMAPPPSAARLPVRWLSVTVSVKRFPSL